MSSLHHSNEGSSLEKQDPWEWNVDQVVFALTNQESFLLKSNQTLSLPDANRFADILYENDVNGLALLTEVNANSLRDDLKVKSMGHRASISHLIRQLQDMSIKYHEQMTMRFARVSSVSMGSRVGTPLGSPQTYDPRAFTRVPGPWHSAAAPDQIQNLPWIDSGTARAQEQLAIRKRANVAKAPEMRQREWRDSRSLASPGGLGISTIKAEDASEEQSHIGGCNNGLRQNIEVSMNPDLASLEQEVRQGEVFIIDETGRKRRRLVLTSADAPNANGSQGQNPTSLSSPCRSSNPMLGNGSAANLVPSKRLSDLELPAETLDEGLAGTREISQSLGDTSPNPAHPTTTLKPGVMLIDKHGQKRVRPVLVSQSELPSDDAPRKPLLTDGADPNGMDLTQPINETEAPSLSIRRMYGRKPNREKDQIYLGPESLPVDKLFYGDTPLESQLDCSTGAEHSNEIDDFAIEPSATSSSGLSLYVNARMKYYLQSRKIELQPGGNDRIGIIPYPDRIGKKHHPLSITIFSGFSDTISALRSNRCKWVKGTSFGAQKSSPGQADAFNVADPVLAVNEADDPDWKALEKWKYMNHGNNVLPVYGESGSEGEYELDTWKEIEQEQGELARPVGPSKSRKLTAEEIEEAVGGAIKQIEKDWDLKRKPKLQRKARRLWMKSRRNGTVKPQMDRLTHQLEQLGNRLVTLRKEIIEEQWSSLGQISKQCTIMQPSIFDHEDSKWELSILTSRITPEKPASTIKKPNVASAVGSENALHSGEEDLLADPDSSESSGGSLQDFIVENDSENDEHPPVHIDGDIPDLPPIVTEDVEVSELSAKEGSESTNVVDPIRDADLQPIQQAKKEPQDKLMGRTSPNPPIVDLTLNSDPIEPEGPKPKPTRFEIKTPPINVSEDESDAFQRSRKRKAVFKKLPYPPNAEVIDLESDTPEATTTRSPTIVRNLFPMLSDVVAIQSMDPSELVERQDRKRLLTWMVTNSPASRRRLVSKRINRLSFESCRSETTKALKELLRYKRRISDVDNETSDTIMSVAAWHVCWTIPVKIDLSGINTAHIRTTLADEDGFEPFYDFLVDCLSRCRKVLDPPDSVTPSKKRRKILPESEEAQGFSSIRKRKYVVNESQETLNQRQAARDRVRADEERRGEEQRRRHELASRFKHMGSNDDGTANVVVNPGKLKNQQFIHLPPEFGNGFQIKEHQTRGLQFLWREVTAEHEDLQGCLLAQTMGLGKTMQVIALLVALSNAAQSESENIRQQIPPSLRESRTLILCPPALLENWWDEFLIWAPRPFSDTIGELRKVSVSLGLADRLSEIEAWSENGGVLLVGYETFKTLVHNTPRVTNKTKATTALLDRARHESVKKALLHGANLVVADEAHYFKNRTSKLNSAIKQIQTRSRIALTGSPLNNNLQEYYTIIDWIAPNYLGTYTEFKATYEEPIKEGLYRQSTNAQYSRSRTKLKALEIEMEPKVHRANLSVLRTDLEGKVEFVVRVPLTKLQEDLYNIFVDAVRAVASGSEPRLTSLWSWLGTLQLLCNHPKCFRDRMLALKTELENPDTPPLPDHSKRDDPGIAEDGLGASDEDAVGLLTEEVTPSAFSQVISQCEDVFQRLVEPDDALSLSNKMQVLMNLLQFSTAAQDKVLVFSHRIATLDYVQEQLERKKIPYARIDGRLLPQKRQSMTKEFNEGNVNICLISTRAGGTGLNFHGANRVVIMDEHFNPAWELQAIGRAYRIGQKKVVYAYRLTAGGTFEQAIQNQALFKEQLATRVVDNKHLSRSVLQEARRYLFPPEPMDKEDLSPFFGKDPQVLDHLLANRTENQIMSIIPSETLRIEDDMPLTEEQKKEAEQMVESEQLRRRDPQAHIELMRKRFQLVEGPARNNILTPVSASYAPASTQPIPWNPPLMGDRNMFPPSTASAFPQQMGGLPYPEVGNQNNPVSESPTTVNGSVIPTVEGQNLPDPSKSTENATNTPPSVEEDENESNGHAEKLHGGGSNSKEAMKRKHSLSGEEPNLTKKGRPTPNSSLNFTAAAPMESRFRKFLEKEAARSIKRRT